jgi:hypothetical protein
MKELINQPIFIAVASALTITLITLFTRWIISRSRTNRIIRYMDETPKTKFRSKYFDSARIAADNNLSQSEVDKLCTKSKKIKKILGVQENWVLRKNYVEDEEILPQHRLL